MASSVDNISVQGHYWNKNTTPEKPDVFTSDKWKLGPRKSFEGMLIMYFKSQV